MTRYFINESGCCAKTTKDIASLLHAHKQQPFGSPKTPVAHFNQQKYTLYDKISQNFFLNQFRLKM